MLEQITEIIQDYTGRDNVVISEDTSLQTDIELNSFELVQIVCEIEERFNIEIPDTEIETFKTVGDVIHYLEENAH